MIDFQGPITLDIYRVLMETMQGLLKTNEFLKRSSSIASALSFKAEALYISMFLPGLYCNPASVSRDAL